MPLKKRLLLAFIFLICLLSLYNLSAALSYGRQSHNLSIGIDNYITFSPDWIFLYILYYPLIVSPYFFLKESSLIKRLFWGDMLVLAFTIPIYLIFIVRIERPEILTNDVASQILSWLFSSDEPVNLFPSQHVAFSWLTSFVMASKSRLLSLFFFIITILISFSVVLIKQHYFVDIPAGIIVAILSYYIIERILPLSLSETNLSAE